MDAPATVSLADELSSAFDSSVGVETGGAEDAVISTPDGGCDPSALDTPPDASTEGTAAARARDEKGRFAKATEDEAAGKPVPADADPNAPAPVAAEPVPAPQVDLPPSTWTPEAKAEYAHLSPVVKAEMKKREADFQRGINQYKELATHGDSFQRAVQPYLPMIQAEGGNPVASISNLLNTAYRLRTGSPAERGQMVMAIAKQFGADLSPWMNAQGQQQPAPGAIDQNALQSYVQQLVAQQTAPLQKYQQSLLTAQQQQEQAATQATQSKIEQFRTAVNQQGQPEHVYFDNVRPLMASLIESGSANTLEDAYAMACRAHPEVAKAVDAEQRLADNARRLGEAKKKADEARRAATANITGQGGIGVADTSKTSLRDELGAAFDRTVAV